MSDEGNRLGFLEERVLALEESVAKLTKWMNFNQQQNNGAAGSRRNGDHSAEAFVTAVNDGNGQNNGNPEGNLEEDVEMVHDYDDLLDNHEGNQQGTYLSETDPPQPNPDGGSSILIEDQFNEDRETSAAAEGSGGDGANQGSNDESTIQQEIETEDEKFYIKIITTDYQQGNVEGTEISQGNSDETLPQNPNPEGVYPTELEDQLNEKTSTAVSRIVDDDVVQETPFRRRYLLPEGVWRVGESSAAGGGSVDSDVNQTKEEGLRSKRSAKKKSRKNPLLQEQQPLKEKLVTRTPLKCPHCSATFSSKSQLAKHIHRCHTTGKRFQCPHCPLGTSRAEHLRRHIRRIHPEEQQNEMAIHMEKKPYQCHHCPIATSRTDHLKRHIRKIHPEVDQNIIHCRICSNKFPSRKILLAHTQKHFQCYFCSKKVRDFEGMCRHFRIHTGEEPFSCPHCQHSTAWEYSLKGHIRSQHPNAKQILPCKRRNGPWNHLRTNGQLHCYFCSFKTYNAGSLVSHFRNHTGEEPFSCSRCPFAAKESGPLKKHFDNNCK